MRDLERLLLAVRVDPAGSPRRCRAGHHARQQWPVLRAAREQDAGAAQVTERAEECRMACLECVQHRPLSRLAWDLELHDPADPGQDLQVLGQDDLDDFSV